jgi:hypothetical protein
MDENNVFSFLALKKALSHVFMGEIVFASGQFWYSKIDWGQDEYFVFGLYSEFTTLPLKEINF